MLRDVTPREATTRDPATVSRSVSAGLSGVLCVVGLHRWRPIVGVRIAGGYEWSWRCGRCWKEKETWEPNP
jgi:hypothetical protein